MTSQPLSSKSQRAVMAIGPWWILTYGAYAALFASEGMSYNGKNMLKMLQRTSFVSDAAASSQGNQNACQHLDENQLTQIQSGQNENDDGWSRENV